jgi:hypothetical protein
MSKKYVIELDDRIKLVTSVGVTENGVVYTTSDYVHNFEELNSDYINEHYGQLQDEAYQAGLNDAWEIARALVWDTSISEYETAGVKVESWDGETCEVLRRYPAHEAVELLRTIREHKDSDRIEVGDEVKSFYTDITGVVTLIDGDTIYILWRDGSSTSMIKLKEVRKTGKHYDIASILEAMRK